jgi:hypothetical protein
MKLNKKYYNIRRFKNGVDMGVIDIPEEHLEMTLRNHPDWINLGEIKFSMETITPPSISQIGYSCPICGSAFGNEKSLQVHKLIHQPIINTVVPKSIKSAFKSVSKKNVKKVAIKRKRKAA